ncbi:MAG: nucleotidyltransferase domain-containing protein [Elusimicrobia bacterium CG08_land_8_20_14_0_20_59_10]|nr:MAG: nucleotidyltransferase domain-containing protein [Elusimicrobia bacterium CG08_land_8_20_14_0_20_59_10]
MNLLHYPVEKLKADLLAIVGRRLDLVQYRLFFFGSRVTNKGDDHSDIDVGIDGPAAVPAQTLGAIKEDLENLPAVYKIDLVDFAAVSGDFKKVALARIEVIK